MLVVCVWKENANVSFLLEREFKCIFEIRNGLSVAGSVTLRRNGGQEWGGVGVWVWVA